MLKRTEYTLDIIEWEALVEYIVGFGYTVAESNDKGFCYIDNGEQCRTGIERRPSYMWDPLFGTAYSDGTPGGLELVIRGLDLMECVDSFLKKR